MSIVGIGVDAEPVASFRRAASSHRERLYTRIFSASELKYCQAFRDPAPHLAARFCAKEAFVKAGRKVSDIRVTDVEVSRTPDGAPFIVPRSKRKEVLSLFKGMTAHLSLSHTDDLAIAFVILTKKPRRKR